MDLTDFYIPSYGRAQKQNTYLLLPPSIQERTAHVIHESEVEAYKRWPTRKIVVTGPLGAPRFRQAALDDSRARAGLAWMMDVDLRFCNRVDGWDFETNNRSEKSPVSKVLEGFEILTGLLERGEFALAAHGARGFNNSIRAKEWKDNFRIMRSFGVNANVLDSYGIRIDKFPYWEDFHVALELAHRGFATRQSVIYTVDAAQSTPGGVSAYRDIPSLLACRAEFVEYHAPYVTPNDTKSAKNWGTTFRDSDVVPDVKIDWAGAFKGRKLR